MQSRAPGHLARSICPAVLGTIAAVFLAAAPTEALPQAGDGSLPLPAMLDRALQANPEILAAGARIRAAAARPDQAGSLPDPMITGVFRNVSFSDITIGDEMMSGAGLRVSQSLPFKGKRDLRTAAASTGIDVAAAQLDVIQRRVVREVTDAYFELAYLTQAVAVVEDTRDYLISLEQTAQARYAVGEGIQQDVLKAQVEISVLMNRLITLEQQHGSVETRLNRMLDQPVTTPLSSPRLPQPPAWNLDLQQIETEAITASALVRERARQVEQTRASLQLAARDTKPDWVVGGGWMYRGELPDVWEVNVGLTLPIYKGSKQERAIEEAEARVQARQIDHRDSTGVVAAAVREHYLHADRAARLVRLYSEATIPQATLSLESAIAGYEVGRVDFLTVLDNVVTLLTYRLEHLRQSTDYLQAIAAIEEHLGRSLGVTPAAALRQLGLSDTGGTASSELTGGEK